MQNTEYRLLTDAYYGTGQFESGGGLQQHPRESRENYLLRQRLAYYLNYTGPIVDASVDPIFKQEINREYNDTELFKIFLDDCDRTGTDFQDFIMRVATFVKLYGVGYVVVNNEADLGDTLDENIKGRKLPYLVEVMPQDVTAWVYDSRGNMLEFTYREVTTDSKGNSDIKYHKWTTTQWFIMDEQENVMSQGEHNLGRVPVVQWFARNTAKSNIKPPSEFSSIAHANYALYQLCSWHMQILRDQTFNILTMPDVGRDNITIGTSNVLVYPPEATHTPSFIAPDCGPANVLTDHMDRLVSEMYRMSGVDSVVGVQSAKSGVAKQWDFERTNQKLAKFAVQCGQAEEAIVQLFELWTGNSIDYHCEYPKDFNINDVADILNNAQTAMDLGFTSKTFNVEVAKKVLSAYLPDIEPEVYDAIISELENAQEIIDKAYGDMNANRTNETLGYTANDNEVPKGDKATN